MYKPYWTNQERVQLNPANIQTYVLLSEGNYCSLSWNISLEVALLDHDMKINNYQETQHSNRQRILRPLHN